MPFLFTQPSYFFDYCSAEGDHTYLVTSNHDYEESTWNAVARDETDDRTILKEGPYPLNKIRTGDNRAFLEVDLYQMKTPHVVICHQIEVCMGLWCTRGTLA